MWNAPLTNEIPLLVATGCALFLFGLSIGLVFAGVCWVFVAASVDRLASSSQESYAYISDDEIEIVIELVRDAVAGDGWTLCGDCYTRNLLQQMPIPAQERERGKLSVPLDLKETDSTRRVDYERHSVQNISDPSENRSERSLRVEQGERMGRVASLSH